MTKVYWHWGSVSSATPIHDSCGVIESRRHLNRTSLALWRRLKGLKRPDMLPHSKEIQEQMWNNVISLERDTKPFLRLWDSSEPQLEPLSTNGQSTLQLWSYQHLFQEEPRSELPQFRSVCRILWCNWAKWEPWEGCKLLTTPDKKHIEACLAFATKDSI